MPPISKLKKIRFMSILHRVQLMEIGAVPLVENCFLARWRDVSTGKKELFYLILARRERF